MPLSKRPGARRRQLKNLIPGGYPAKPGDKIALQHGGYAEIARAELEPVEREVFDALADDLPLREADGSAPAADAVVVSLLAEALVHLRSVRAYLGRRGIEDEKGRLRPAAELQVRLRSQALDLAKELGMTPASRVRLGIDLVRAETAAEDAAAHRAARQRLDERFAALDDGEGSE